MMEYEISKTLQEALDGDTTAAAAMWRLIAEGRASAIEAQLWVKAVADRVVTDVLNPEVAANRRAEAALHALGFYGRIDKDRQLRNDVALLDEFNEDVKLTQAEVVKTIQLINSDLDGLTLKNAIKKVYRVRKKY